MIALVELADCGAELALAVPADKRLDVLPDDSAGSVEHVLSLGLRGRDDLLQVVEVVEVDVFDFANRRLDVARDGDIDEKNPPVAARCSRNRSNCDRVMIGCWAGRSS